MKTYMRQSILRMAILTGFIGLEVIDLAEKFAMYYASQESLVRIHTVTSLLSLSLVGVCVYLVMLSAPTRFERPGSNVNAELSGPHTSDAMLEEQALTLP